MRTRDGLIGRLEIFGLSQQAAKRAVGAFEAEIRKNIAADVRAAAPKYLDNEMDQAIFWALDALAKQIENPDKDN